MDVFDSVVDYLRMGGYALYVWWSYGIVMVVLAINLAVPSLRHRRLRRALAQKARPVVPSHDES